MRVEPIKLNSVSFEKSMRKNKAKNETKSAPKKFELRSPVDIAANIKNNLQLKRDFNELYNNDFTKEARQFYDKVVNIAEDTGSQTVETWHGMIGVINEMAGFIENINKGILDPNSSSISEAINTIVEDIGTSENIFARPEDRQKMLEVLSKHKKAILEHYQKHPISSKGPKGYPSDKMLYDITAIYELTNKTNPDSDDKFASNMFYCAGFISESDDDYFLAKQSKEMYNDLRKIFFVEPIKKDKYHLDVYDDKADNIWKNISKGNDSAVLCDSENAANMHYFINSFTNLLHKPNQKYPNIDPDKVDISIIGNGADYSFFTSYIDSLKENKANKGRLQVVILNLTNIIKRTEGTISVEMLEFLKNKKITEDEPDIRYVAAMTPETYYFNINSGAILQPALVNYSVQELRSLNINDAKKSLTNENGLKFVEAKTGKKFSQDTIMKAVDLVKDDKGTYPDKVLDLLNVAAKTDPDKEVTPEIIAEYYTDMKALSDVSSKDSDVKFIYDTGKKLSDILGSPMTKANAQSIVNQIKNQTIGTRGFTIYLEDGSAYGGGRRHSAEAIAGETGIPMVAINARDFALKDIDAFYQNGELPEMKIRKIVNAAKAQAKANKYNAAMIYIENFDNFAADPLYGISSVYERKAFSQLLSEMDNARKNDNVNLIVVGSTNMPEIIDPNVLKPYKFLDSIIIYPPQSSDERKELLNYYADKMNIKIKGDTKEEKDKIIDNIAQTTEGFRPVDIIYLLETTRAILIEKGQDEADSSDFTEAFLQTVTGRLNTRKMSEADKKIVASHEAGHAINSQIMLEVLEGTSPSWQRPDEVDFITLDPRGSFGGCVYSKERPDKNSQYSYERIMADLVCDYGGHSVEKQLFNMEGSWGISQDMRLVDTWARAMVLDMGMGVRTGAKHIPRNPDGSLDVSDATKKIIEDDIDKFEKGALEISDKIVETYRGFIEYFANKYIDKVGTGECIISGDEFRKTLSEYREMHPELKEKDKELAKFIKDNLSFAKCVG